MKLWGGRFGGETDDQMRQFNDSFPFDWRLYEVDIQSSMAYARALARAGLLTDEERDAILDGLARVRREFEEGTFEAKPDDEDIHTAVERRLTERVGPVGGKLHTGRSRNDQIALDVRLWALEAIGRARHDLAALQGALLKQAKANPTAIMPGYTHLQPAQPVLFAHWLLSTFWALERDRERLANCARRTAVSPLGSGALGGTPFPIDRAALAEDLGLHEVSPNSMDAVGDRDFIAEFLFAAALIGVHVSRLAEDLILYSSPGYRFVTLDERYTTGSSLMPQKRNPDALELARGKAGRLLGHLTGLLAMLKGLPSAYNKDLQEDKEPLFDAADTLALTLPVVTGVVETLTANPDAMRAALDDDMLATDLADYLVERGMPFREAHHIVGGLVKLAEERGRSLARLSVKDYKTASPAFEADVKDVFDFERSVGRRKSTGGTAPEAVAEQIRQAHALLQIEQGDG